MTGPADRVVVADTSSLVFAHVIDPDLLRRLYGRILVPEAVWEELEEGLREGQPGPDVPSTPWMEVRPTTLAPAVQAADANLGRGEAAVLSLALSPSRPRRRHLPSSMTAAEPGRRTRSASRTPGSSASCSRPRRRDSSTKSRP